MGKPAGRGAVSGVPPSRAEAIDLLAGALLTLLLRAPRQPVRPPNPTPRKRPRAA